MEIWQRLLVVGIVLVLTLVAARVIDRRMAASKRSPETLTRYRVLRRTITALIVTFGVLSALLVIPQVSALAGALLASTAVIGLVVGFAAQRTLGNFVAGLMIAFTQPLRLGDWVGVGGEEGTVEEIGLMYTFIRTHDNARVVIPNEKLASDTIRNSTIRSPAKFAQVTVQVPPTTDLGALVERLRPEASGGTGRGLRQLTRRVADPDAASVDRERGGRRAARAGAPAARARPAARAGPLRMTPPRGGRHGADDHLVVARRRKRRRADRKRSRRRAVILGLVAGVALLFVVGGTAVTGVATLGTSCDLNALRPVAIGENSFMYAADGSTLGVIPAERNRQPVTMKQISPWLPQATIAIEDRRFYEHGGIDPSGIARAVWADIRAGKVVQGGSTITQQLVRNLYPVSREQTIQRKLKEACLAIKLNRAWPKEKILVTYMNQVYYGNLAYGIEAAAQTYFSKHAKNLNLPEAALLAGLPQLPSAYDPFNQTETATARRDQVLRAMLENGDIDRAKYEWAVKRGLGLKAGKLYTTIREPYFFSYVRDQLIAAYGVATVRSGGLKVYTTIHPRFQRAARRAITETLYEKTDPAAAVISINPANGAIRAMTAVTPGTKKNQFNLLSQARRQAGSTFKTFVLAAAVEQGVNPETTGYQSAPFYYRPDPNGDCESGTWWCVETYGHDYYGWSSIESATLRSDNTVYAQLTLDVTPEKVGKMAEKLGVRTPLKVDGAYVPSMGLGSIAVSPLDMASAYATLAAGGVYSEPMAIRKVVLPNGKEDDSAGWGKPKRKRVISDGVAYTVTKILEQNMQAGTGTGAQFGHSAAGKTGTTDDHADAWFCGYTPRLQTTVWIGYPEGEIPMENVHGISVSGGSFPAQIWRLFMGNAIGHLESRDWTEPTDWPEWSDFEQGQYARSFDYSDDDDYYVPPAEPEDESEEPEEAEPEPPVEEAPPVVTTQAPPPPTTTEAPPPVTTEPPLPPTEPPPPPTVP